jgi:hypothetical protein
MPLRHEVWTRLGGDLKPPRLAEIASGVVPLTGVLAAGEALVERRALGRTLVACAAESLREA